MEMLKGERERKFDNCFETVETANNTGIIIGMLKERERENSIIVFDTL